MTYITTPREWLENRLGANSAEVMVSHIGTLENMISELLAALPKNEHPDLQARARQLLSHIILDDNG